MDGVHDGYDRRKQAVKKADEFVIEKVWAAVYETSRQHGDLPQKSNSKCQNILKETCDTREMKNHVRW